jgi:hypothetical protein
MDTDADEQYETAALILAAAAWLSSSRPAAAIRLVALAGRLVEGLAHPRPSRATRRPSSRHDSQLTNRRSPVLGRPPLGPAHRLGRPDLAVVDHPTKLKHFVTDHSLERLRQRHPSPLDLVQHPDADLRHLLDEAVAKTTRLIVYEGRPQRAVSLGHAFAGFWAVLAPTTGRAPATGWRPPTPC